MNYTNSISVIYLVVASMIFLTSCECNRVNSAVKGYWSIDTISYFNNDVKSCLQTNIIHLENEQIGNFPGHRSEYCDIAVVGHKAKIRWKISQNDSKQLIFSINEVNGLESVFNGNHHVIFYGDMRIRS